VIDVLVDGRPMEGAGAYRGFGRYLRAVVTHAAGATGVFLSALVTDPQAAPPGVRPVRVRRRVPGRFADLEHDILLPFGIRAARPDVFHSPGSNPPWRCDPPWVQTVQDVIPLIVDHADLADERRRWLRRARRIRRAAAVITPSQASANDIIRLLGVDARRVHVAPLGVDTTFEVHGARQRDDDAPFVLVVAEYAPYKGYAEAFAAVAGLADRGHPHRLRVVGRIAPWKAATIDGLVAAAPRPDLIELCGYVGDDELARLYRSADALLVTSRAEGFGFPAVEAMASGTPVVAFSNTSTTEVVDGGGVLVADGDVAAMVDAASALLRDGPRWSDASDRARERAKAFSWATCAAMHVDVYRAVAGA
jgi:alpha-1,3-rhamnosyl/mannosyltransferase